MQRNSLIICGVLLKDETKTMNIRKEIFFISAPSSRFLDKLMART